jgi:hypothetical protein
MRFLSAPLLLSLAVPAAASSPDPTRLAVPPAELAKARELVQLLGSETFEEREDAYERLAKMGRLAKPVLAAALRTDPDAEVRARCRALLPRAAAEDLKARLDTFLADADGQFDHDLPGWSQFRAVAGQTAGARELFVELLGDPTNRALVLAVGGPAGELGALVAARKVELYNWRLSRPGGARRQATAADVTALLFAESFAASRQALRTVTVSTLFTTPGFTSAVLEPDARGAAVKAVVSKWLDTRDDPVQMYQALSTVANLGFGDEIGRVAARLLGADGALGIHRGTAALTLAQLKAKEHAAALERQLGDETPVPARPTAHTLQVRDAALVALLLLSGQDPEEYGFSDLARNSSSLRFSYTRYGITDLGRAAAHTKWKAWRAENPDWASPAKK